jgi:uncharacterized membrane protein YkvA (DUF1232 family)
MAQQANSNNQQRRGVLDELMMNLQLAWNLMLDSRVPIAIKAMVPVLGLLYMIVPLDLLPDVVPFLGQVDDVVVLLLLVRLFIGLAPKDVVAQYRMGGSGAARNQSQTGGQRRSQPGNSANPREDFVDADFRVMNE